MFKSKIHFATAKHRVFLTNEKLSWKVNCKFQVVVKSHQKTMPTFQDKPKGMFLWVNLKRWNFQTFQNDQIKMRRRKMQQINDNLWSAQFFPTFLPPLNAVSAKNTLQGVSLICNFSFFFYAIWMRESPFWQFSWK